MHDGTGVEIERTYLLDGLPPLPPTAVPHRLEQGYLPDAASAAGAPTETPDGVPLLGRIRRRVGPDGTEHLTHTVKTGVGLVREERERTIDRDVFEAAWPRTEGRRIAKTRYVVPGEGGVSWEIDEFDDHPLVLAEVELPDEDARPPMPAWLAPHVVREVTDEPGYTNSALASVGPPPA